MEEISEIREKEGRRNEGYHDYRLMSCHGRSAIGTVSAHGRRWFVKSLHPQFMESSSARASLRKEFDILLSLNHPGIVRVIEFAEIPGAGPSIIMEFLDGKHLDEAVRDMKRSQRILIAQQLLDALEYLHSRGISHGDLKPENIIVRGTALSPRLTLIDFNIADSKEYTVDKEAGGNRRYAAPEQFDAGYRLAPSADVYSFALILKEMRLGPGWQATIRKSLAADPALRLKDAAAMKRLHRSSRKRLFSLTFLSLSVILGVFLMIFLTRGAAEEPYRETLIAADTASVQVNSQQEPAEVAAEEPAEASSDLKELPSKEVSESATKQLPRELALLDPQRRRAEAEIAQIVDNKEKQVRQVLADSSLTVREKIQRIGTSGIEAFKETNPIFREVYIQIPPKYIMDPPEQWRDFISEKKRGEFINWVSKTIDELRESEK